jgi:hypothetical protein
MEINFSEAWNESGIAKDARFTLSRSGVKYRPDWYAAGDE